MPAEPFIAFFLIRGVNRMLRKRNQPNPWSREMNILSYAIVILLAIELISHTDQVFKWVWHLLLLAMIAFALTRIELAATRTLMYAILPFAILSLGKDLYTAISGIKNNVVNNYLDTAVIFSLIWMVAMIFVSNKQQKALEKERKKTQQEEEQRKWMAIRKEELEKVVAERTAELRGQKEQVENALAELKSTQALLIQSEKMASLGELTAGIAHEIQNPLNFVNNFSEVNTELIQEMKDALEKGDVQEAITLSKDIQDNSQKIIFHGKRADSIVKGMLQHSRSSSGIKEPTDINALADEYLRLAYHGLRAKDKSFNAEIKTDFDEHIANINICPQDVGRVILNLITNAFYAVMEKKKRLMLEKEDSGYQPTVWVSTKKRVGKVEIRVVDNADGIVEEIVGKIFQPFFTTKPTGKGTGLGLSMSYDIITKGHSGELKLETKPGEGSTFIIILPV
jgi:two-component system NtrC family sensor kinase